jgi:hypothetical protein
MKVKDLKKILNEMPDDLMVLVPIGVDWKEPVQVREEGAVQTNFSNWTHRQGAPTRAVFIRPYLGPSYPGDET